MLERNTHGLNHSVSSAVNDQIVLGKHRDQKQVVRFTSTEQERRLATKKEP